MVPASELAAARAEIAKLQRVLGKKTLENVGARTLTPEPPRECVPCSNLVHPELQFLHTHEFSKVTGKR